MRILFALTYFCPYISGVTVCIQRLAEGLIARGHEVTILTSRYDNTLPEEETSAGVHIRRLPVFLRISKGALMAGYYAQAKSLVRHHDVVVMNLPNTPLEAWLLPLIAWRLGKPLLGTHHCDVVLPPGIFNSVVGAVVNVSNRLATSRIDGIVSYTYDYAAHSPLLRHLADRCEVIAPPIPIEPACPDRVEAFKRMHAPHGERLIGFAARLAAEKGLEYLLDSLPLVEHEVGPIRLLLAGECGKVIGEGSYRNRLLPRLAAQGDRCQILGELTRAEMAVFFAACEVTVLPSINSTESFGMVQVESMLCGTPVVASDLPGVRAPVRQTGMGIVVPPRDHRALAEALIEVLRHPAHFQRERAFIESCFSFEQSLTRYEALLQHLHLENEKKNRPRRTHRFLPRAASERVYPSGRDYLRDQIREMPPFLALVRSVECRLFQRLGPLDQSVLDLGCGDGHFASMAFDAPLFAGLDRDHAQLLRANRMGAHRHLLRSDATRLPFADGSFQTVIANSVLEHIPDLAGSLREIKRVLRMDGRFIFSTPSHHFGQFLLGSTLARQIGLQALAKLYAQWFNRRSLHWHVLTPENWIQQLAGCGLAVEHWEYYVSDAAHRAFDLAHYLSLPRLLSPQTDGPLDNVISAFCQSPL